MLWVELPPIATAAFCGDITAIEDQTQGTVSLYATTHSGTQLTMQHYSYDFSNAALLSTLPIAGDYTAGTPVAVSLTPHAEGLIATYQSGLPVGWYSYAPHKQVEISLQPNYTLNKVTNSQNVPIDFTEQAEITAGQVYKKVAYPFVKPTSRIAYRTYGNKSYELTDHLGNVALTISDAKTAVQAADGSTHYQPQVLTATDYYPFGMPMPGRSFSMGNYRYGFNGQEKINEVYGFGNLNIAEFWLYDTRLARRWNRDPIDQISMSNYSVLGNNPIMNIDPDGDWWFSKSINNQSYTNHDNGRRISIQGASEYSYTMSNVLAVLLKQDSYASYIPFIGSVLNSSALIQKLEDPSMKIDVGDIISIALGGYFKGTRKIIKSAGVFYSSAKTALRISEEFTILISNIATSPNLKESWIELAVMQSFDNMKSENGNEIGFMRGNDQSAWQTTFHFSENYISELQELYENQFDNLSNNSNLNRNDYIDTKIEEHLRNLFEQKKREIIENLD